MSEKTALSHLEHGTIACLGNARRLIDDAEILLHKNSYLSSFLLSGLAMEEIAKAFKLIEKSKHKEGFTRKEWKKWTTRKGSHIIKLKFVHQVDDKWLQKVVKGFGVNYEEFEKGFLKNFPSIKDMDDYRERTSTMFYNLRLDTLYVNYDFERKQWIEPLKSHISTDSHFSFQGLIRAKHLLSILEHEAKYATELE